MIHLCRQNLAFRLAPIVTFVVVALCTLTVVGKQEDAFRRAQPSDVGLNEDVLNELTQLLESDVESGKLVGCAALIYRDGQIAYDKMFGFADKESDQTIEDDTIYRIYSMSKPITSVAVMMLVESGDVELDEPIATYMPEFEEMTVLVTDDEGNSEEVPADKPITVRDLLRHTSGFTYGFFGNSEVDQRYLRAGVLMRDSNLEAMTANLAEIPLKHQPATRFEYSVSTDVLGRIVEVASGMTFDVFLDERIFKPLGMNDTSFIVPASKRERFAAMYSESEDDGLVRSSDRRSARFLSEHQFFSGGGGLCSTTYDYLRFSRMLLNAGEWDGTRILSEESIEEMTRNQLTGDIDAGSFQFGLGFSIDRQGRYGWGGAAGTRFWVDPANQVIGIFMVQINPYSGDNYQSRMQRIIQEALD